MSRRLRPRDKEMLERMAEMYLAGATITWLSEHYDQGTDRIKAFFKRRGIKRDRLHWPGSRAAPVEHLMRQAGFI